jgi:small subunit ribosomal protein S18
MPKKRGKNKDNARRSKKKISILNLEKVEYVDYKDVNLLRRFMSDRAKIRARRVTGNDAQQQREVAQAIKNAREMALQPYTNRVTQSRTGGGGRGRDRDREASEGPMPTPAAPPPSPAGPPPARGDEGTDAPEVDAPEVVEVETVEAGSSDA